MAPPVDLKRAVRDVFTSSRLLLVVGTGALVGLVSQAFSRLPYELLSYAAAALLFGYMLSYARQVAAGGGGLLPAPTDFVAYVRRFVVVWVATLVPAFVLGIAVNAVALLFYLVFGATAFGSARNGLAGALLTLSAVAYVALSVIIAARYVFYDDRREAFRYVDALRHVVRVRQVLAMPVAFNVAWPLMLVFARYSLGLLLDSRMLTDLPTALQQLAAGRLAGRSLGIVAAALGLSALSTVSLLVGCHLVGQLALVAYGSQPKVVGGWSNNGVQQTG